MGRRSSGQNDPRSVDRTKPPSRNRFTTWPVSLSGEFLDGRASHRWARTCAGVPRRHSLETCRKLVDMGEMMGYDVTCNNKITGFQDIASSLASLRRQVAHRGKNTKGTRIVGAHLPVEPPWDRCARGTIPEGALVERILSGSR
jgi:hypothetical protein